jgi:signal transduction histidine kinase
MMPGMSGLEVLEKVRSQHSPLSLPIIMVTADDLEKSIVTALHLGANDYLVKPLQLQVALARIRNQLTLKDLAGLKDEFVRFASHDLKKPLIVMLDIAQTLKDECIVGQPTTADTLELIELINKTGHNMQHVIEGFLHTESNATTQHEPQYRPVELNRIVAKSLQANINYAKRKGVLLCQELQNNLPLVEADEFRISQVLDNLIGNAMKFSPDQTTTIVRTRCDNDYVYAEVCDGGPGLSEEDMRKLFTRYAKLSNIPTGGETSSGIGLSMSKQFIDMHHGRIGARNNPTQGATFWFGLPIKH